jgi:hypothetical protein
MGVNGMSDRQNAMASTLPKRCLPATGRATKIQRK